MTNKISRRRFIGMTVMTGAAALAPWVNTQAQDLPHVSEDDPSAKALGYRHDAASVDVEQFPRRAGAEGAKQLCNNCALYQGNSEWGPCAIFPGKAVNGKGWCNAWAPQAA